jgi:hypothetical protein
MSDAQAHPARASAEALVPDLLAFMAQTHPPAETFETLALRLFAHQYRYNLPFQRYAQTMGRTPRTVKRWEDIPAVPINAFKDLTLSCEPPEACERTFMTSGTTRAEVRGRHHHPHLQVYDTSMVFNFGRRFMRGQDRLPMGVLFPTEAMMPHSSLAHYLALALTHFGEPGSAYLLDEGGLLLDRLCAMLERAQNQGQPVALLGASYSLVHAMDALHERGLRFQLPAGSRVLDTGGFKGQSREMAAADFYALLSDTLGVPAGDCINMYGMTELSTQFYDKGNAVLPAVKSGPHWIRTLVVDPVTGVAVPEGQTGVLVHCDLGNFNAVTTILTEDVGVATGDGFLLFGRAQGAEAKGCSMAVDAFLQAARS